jgi:hypothetical protein
VIIAAGLASPEDTAVLKKVELANSVLTATSEDRASNRRGRCTNHQTLAFAAVGNLHVIGAHQPGNNALFAE